MRDGILDQLPKSLPEENIVLVIGPASAHGQNSVKSLIEELNRSGRSQWIRYRFNGQIFESDILAKSSVILTMVGLNHGSLANTRNAAKNLQVCCPNQALTVGETKEILRALSKTRKGVTLPVERNGNGSHPAPGEGEGQRLDNLAKSAEETSQVFSTALRHPVAVAPEATEPEVDATPVEEIADDPEEVVAALAAIEKFREVSDETEVAVMMVGDRLKAITAERDGLQRQLGVKDEEIVQLRSQLEASRKMADERAALTEKNKSLEAEVRKLRTTLDQFENLIKGVRK